MPVAFVVLAMVVSGCGGAAESSTPRTDLGSPLVLGERGARAEGAEGGARLARWFAHVYAAGAYSATPPVIPTETGRVQGALTAAAARVPVALRRLRPHLRWVRLSLTADGSIAAVVAIGAPGSSAFTVAFRVARRDGVWMVTSISLPD